MAGEEVAGDREEVEYVGHRRIRGGCIGIVVPHERGKAKQAFFISGRGGRADRAARFGDHESDIPGRSGTTTSDEVYPVTPFGEQKPSGTTSPEDLQASKEG